MSVSAKGKQQKLVRQLQCHEQCIEHIPYYLSGLSRAHFFPTTFLEIAVYRKKKITLRTLQNSVCCELFLSKLQWCDRDRSKEKEIYTLQNNNSVSKYCGQG